MANWELLIAIGAIAAAMSLDWVLWRHHAKAEARDLDRLSREAAAVREKASAG